MYFTFFGSGKWPESVSPKTVDRIKCISDSKICKEVYERAYIANPNVDREELVVLMGVTWSDDFDPNSSIKANRGAV